MAGPALPTLASTPSACLRVGWGQNSHRGTPTRSLHTHLGLLGSLLPGQHLVQALDVPPGPQLLSSCHSPLHLASSLNALLLSIATKLLVPSWSSFLPSFPSPLSASPFSSFFPPPTCGDSAMHWKAPLKSRAS